MRLTIELTPEQGAQLRAAAKTRGIDYTEMAREIVADHLPAVTPGDVVASQLEEAALTVDAENAAAIAYLKARLAAGANASAEEVRQVEEEYEEIKRNLNANRAAKGLSFREPPHSARLFSFERSQLACRQRRIAQRYLSMGCGLPGCRPSHLRSRSDRL